MSYFEDLLESAGGYDAVSKWARGLKEGEEVVVCASGFSYWERATVIGVTPSFVRLQLSSLSILKTFRTSPKKGIPRDIVLERGLVFITDDYLKTSHSYYFFPMEGIPAQLLAKEEKKKERKEKQQADIKAAREQAERELVLIGVGRLRLFWDRLPSRLESLGVHDYRKLVDSLSSLMTDETLEQFRALDDITVREIEFAKNVITRKYEKE